MAARFQVTFDAADPHALARWWADLLGYEVEDLHDGVQRLLDDGLLSPEQVLTVDGRLTFADATAAGDPGGSGPRLYFQRVPEPAGAKNRVHLDVQLPGDLDELVERLTATGATFVRFDSHPGHRWAVLSDPEGNVLCVTPPPPPRG